MRVRNIQELLELLFLFRFEYFEIILFCEKFHEVFLYKKKIIN